MSDYQSMRKWITPILIIGVFVSMYLEDRAKGRSARVELPGFSIELPGGEVLATSQAPAGGSHKVHVHPSLLGIVTRRELTNPQLVIQWMAQRASLEDWRTIYLPLFVQALGAKFEKHQVLKEEALDDQHWLFIISFSDENLPMGIGVVKCDEDFEVMVIYGRYRSAGRQATELGKVLRSVRCTVREANRTKLRAALRLPEKFGRTSDAEFEGYKSLDGEMLVINFTNGDVLRDRGTYKVIAKGLLASGLGTQIPDSGIDYLPDPALRHRASLIRARIPDNGLTTYVGSQYCELQEQTLIFMWVAPEAGDALAAERLGQVGCPGDASADVRPFRDLAAEACRNGNQAACAMHDSLD